MSVSTAHKPVRAVRRRAPLLRRRYAGRYVFAEVLPELALDAPRVGNLIADAVHLRDRIAGSRACREHWLADCVDDYALDAAVVATDPGRACHGGHDGRRLRGR
jgi:hypothetical protein